MHGTAANLHHPDLKGVTYLFGEVCGGMGNLRRLNLGASLETGLHLNRTELVLHYAPHFPSMASRSRSSSSASSACNRREHPTIN